MLARYLYFEEQIFRIKISGNIEGIVKDLLTKRYSRLVIYSGGKNNIEEIEREKTIGVSFQLSIDSFHI
jgi:Mg2+/Co2+ transporter CorB